MSISTFLGVASFSKLAGPADDDAIDRLNHLYTVIVVVLFSFASTGGQFIGSPIDCLMPANFYGSYVSYVQSYCFIRNNYYVPLDRSIPMDVREREKAELTYYQWVPIMLLFMALLFKMPCVVWRMLTRGYGINLDKITDIVMSLDVGPPGKRMEDLRMLSEYVDRWLTNRRRYRAVKEENALGNTFIRRIIEKFNSFIGKAEGTFLTKLYILIKLLYVVNVVGQFFLLNVFMGDWYSAYGYEVVREILEDATWKESPRFPRMTLCDVQIRQLENVQRYTIQCVLGINMFNEKIFLFLWFWLFLVGILSAFSFLLWLWRLGPSENRVSYVLENLELLDLLKAETEEGERGGAGNREGRGGEGNSEGRQEEGKAEKETDEEVKKDARKFTLEYLGNDGVLVLRLVANNTNYVLMEDVFAALWRMYREKKRRKAAEEKEEKEKEENKKEESEKKKKQGEEERRKEKQNEADQKEKKEEKERKKKDKEEAEKKKKEEEGRKQKDKEEAEKKKKDPAEVLEEGWEDAFLMF